VRHGVWVPFSAQRAGDLSRVSDGRASIFAGPGSPYFWVPLLPIASQNALQLPAGPGLDFSQASGYPKGVLVTVGSVRPRSGAQGACRQPCQAEPRMMLQKFSRLNAELLSAITSALTVPNVVAGRCFMPS
jgi:hypothetical protein